MGDSTHVLAREPLHVRAEELGVVHVYEREERVAIGTLVRCAVSRARVGPQVRVPELGLYELDAAAKSQGVMAVRVGRLCASTWASE